ncbi:MAG: molecular chaperone HtpG [Gammaproteobacteria bacterium]|nr:molecular chaperone HtpG [Gammaproteobacteria bacterium]
MANEKTTLGFQTEVKQLLQLMIHSLYSNKEIFLRELISNSSDANDRLRFAAVSNGDLLEDQPDLEVRIELDADAGTIAIIDTGIGMSRDDVIEHLGTIAKSGTSEFINSLSDADAKQSALIGQFGVGFYSSFIVADRVEVFTRRAGLPAAEGVHWESAGEGDFTIENINQPERGTRIVLHLRDDATEFLDSFRLQALIRKYSDHIAFPVKMLEPEVPANDEDGTEQPPRQFVSVNSAKALWTRARTEIDDEEYNEFYKHVAHDFQDPILWSHNKVEGKREYTSLLYLPAKAPFDMQNREAPRGLKLYVQRVFIMDDAERFLPLYLRFVRGVIDTNDLSLNVSRELLQEDANVTAIRGALTKRVLDMIAKLAKDDAAKYQNFWNEFGRVLKEGPAEDSANREQLAKLLRFSTTHTNSETQDQSLDDYISRVQGDKKKIYYVVGDNFGAAKSSPHLEIFRKKGIEVLLLAEPIDEWLMGQLREYQEHTLVDITRGALELSELGESEDLKPADQLLEENKALVERLSGVLADQVSEVRATQRLTDSPACLVLGEYDIGEQMRKIMAASGQAVPESKPVLELNPEHPLIIRLSSESADESFAELGHLLFDQAALAEGRQLADPGAFVQRMNRLLIELSA